VRVLVTGATGYIGGRLVPRLRERNYDVRCFSRAAERLRGRFDADVEVVEGDIADEASLANALRGCYAAYYLVHTMGSTRASPDADRAAARRFGDAARTAGIATIIYLRGLGDERDALSSHLRSRHEVGDVLRASGVRVVEFRAALIIGRRVRPATLSIRGNSRSNAARRSLMPRADDTEANVGNRIYGPSVSMMRARISARCCSEMW
jgi:uncharacterized protein YbjT (DUF2867 family)